MSTQMIELTFLALAFTSAMVGGVFLSFSDFVMRGFAQSEDTSAIDCMQGLNRTVFRSLFLFSFLALTPLTIGVAFYTKEILIYTAAAVYFIFVFLVTVRGNVPMNEKLDKMDKLSAEAKAYWPIYLKGWTRWNHIRTVGSLVTSLLFLIAAFRGGQY